MGKFSVGATVVITEDSPLKGRTGTITGVSKTSEHILYVQLREGGAHIPVGDQEMRAASQQCQDCHGQGETLFNNWYPDKCETCDGTGTINRTGPYRLADGTWSDGIDRTARIATLGFSITNPDRVRVLVCYGCFEKPGATVLRGNITDPIEKCFPTFAEAVAYADHHARTTKNGDNK